MDGKNRKDIKPGLRVNITQKHDQRTGRLTSGIVKDKVIRTADALQMIAQTHPAFGVHQKLCLDVGKVMISRDEVTEGPAVIDALSKWVGVDDHILKVNTATLNFPHQPLHSSLRGPVRFSGVPR